MDFSCLREPVEVYEAADGNPEPLAQRIESGAAMQEWERDALVAYLRGELVPPKRGPGQRTLPHLAVGTKEALKRLRIENSVVLLRYWMAILRKERNYYGKFKEVLDYVAKHDRLSDVEIESVLNRYRRSKKPKDCPDTVPAKGIVIGYHRWLLRTGRLPDYPQPVDHLSKLNILEGLPDPRK